MGIGYDEAGQTNALFLYDDEINLKKKTTLGLVPYMKSFNERTPWQQFIRKNLVPGYLRLLCPCPGLDGVCFKW
jgi:hypothetical protein